jgi:hypothetical protein
MENGRAGMINALLVLVLIGFAAALVDTLFRHGFAMLRGK